MAELKNVETAEIITPYVSLDTRQEVTRIIHKSLDGKQYIQRIGNPVITYLISVYVNESGKEKLMHAEDSGALLSVTVKSGEYVGRIIELKEFEKLPAGFYKTTAALAVETEG